MKSPLLFCLMFVSLSALADGYMFDSSGRVAGHKVTEIALTKRQIKLIDYYYKCRSNKFNYETPYFFMLTPKQSETLKKESGFSLTRFAIASSYNHDEGMELSTNMINRFSREQAEIPHKLLIPSQEAEEWELDVMGWSPESRFKDLSIEVLDSGICNNT
jgi:hypothetical protein